MSEAIVIAIISGLCTAVPTSIIALAAWNQSKKNAVKSDTITDATNEIVKRADNLASKTEVIHDLVNSNLKTVQDDLLAAQKKIDALMLIIENLGIQIPSLDTNTSKE